VLDSVRAIACLTVLDFHINLMTRDTHIWNPTNLSHRLISAIALAGASGVTLFFVLSDFLLFMPYAKALLHVDWIFALILFSSPPVCATASRPL